MFFEFEADCEGREKLFVDVSEQVSEMCELVKESEENVRKIRKCG
jgi:hypothetical protein